MPSREKLGHFQKKLPGTPRKPLTPQKTPGKSPTRGKKHILTKEQMKNQRKLTDMIWKRKPEKRKNRENQNGDNNHDIDVDTLPSKRLCESPTIANKEDLNLNHTPQKFKAGSPIDIKTEAYSPFPEAANNNNNNNNNFMVRGTCRTRAPAVIDLVSDSEDPVPSAPTSSLPMDIEGLEVVEGCIENIGRTCEPLGDAAIEDTDSNDSDLPTIMPLRKTPDSRSCAKNLFASIDLVTPPVASIKERSEETFVIPDTPEDNKASMEALSQTFRGMLQQVADNTSYESNSVVGSVSKSRASTHNKVGAKVVTIKENNRQTSRARKGKRLSDHVLPTQSKVKATKKSKSDTDIQRIRKHKNSDLKTGATVSSAAQNVKNPKLKSEETEETLVTRNGSDNNMMSPGSLRRIPDIAFRRSTRRTSGLTPVKLSDSIAEDNASSADDNLLATAALPTDFLLTVSNARWELRSPLKMGLVSITLLITYY